MRAELLRWNETWSPVTVIGKPKTLHIAVPRCGSEETFVGNTTMRLIKVHVDGEELPRPVEVSRLKNQVEVP